MIRLLFASCLISLLAAPLQAQQRFRRTSFPVNSFIINPAVAGTEPVTVLGSTYRHQWAGFDGAPTTTILSAHSSFPNSIGAGVIFYNDDMGGLFLKQVLRLRVRIKLTYLILMRFRLV